MLCLCGESLSNSISEGMKIPPLLFVKVDIVETVETVDTLEVRTGYLGIS